MIKFNRLNIKNFLSFKDIKFEFNNNGVYLINGLNGSGKSSIFEALAWVLFGKTFKNLSESEIVNNKEEENCFVALLFEINDKQYKVVKTKKHTEYKDTTMLFVKINEQWENISGATQQDTHKEIEKLIGVNFKVFQQSIMLNSFAKSFAEMTDSEIKAVFDDLLDFEVYTQLQNINKLKLNEIKDEYQELKNNKISEDNVLKTIQNSISDLDIELTTIKSINNDKIETLQFKINDINKNIETLNKEKATFDFDENEYNESIKTVKNNTLNIENITDNINRKENKLTKLQTQITSNAEFIEKLKNDIIEIDIESIDNDINICEKEYKKIKQDIDEIRKINSEAKANKAVIENQIKQQVNTIKHFESLTKCPTCQQEVSDKYKDIIINNCNKQIAVLNDEITKIEIKSIEAFENQINVINEKIKKLNTEKLKAENNNKKKSQIKQYKDEIQEFKNQIIEFENDLLKYKTEKDTLISATSKLQEQLENDSELYQKMKQFNNAINAFKKEIESNNRLINELNESIRNQIIRIDNFKNKLVTKENEIKIISDKMESINNNLQYYDYIDEMFGNGGIRSYLLANITPVLNNIANKFSTEITNGYITINFETQTYIKSTKKWKEKFAVNVENKYGGKTFHSNSSGEKTLIDLMVLESLSYLISLRAGKAFNIKIFDETFAAVDTENSQKIIDYLQVQGENKLIYVISHDLNFKNYFDEQNTINVSKINGYTTLV